MGLWSMRLDCMDGVAALLQCLQPNDGVVMLVSRLPQFNLLQAAADLSQDPVPRIEI